MVVTPMEVVKIRLQAQQHSLADPLEAPRYRNAGHAVYKIVREEGFATLYRGVSLTALRQATNQGASPFLLFRWLGRVGCCGRGGVRAWGRRRRKARGRGAGSRAKDRKTEADDGFAAQGRTSRRTRS